MLSLHIAYSVKNRIFYWPLIGSLTEMTSFWYITLLSLIWQCSNNYLHQGAEPRKKICKCTQWEVIWEVIFLWQNTFHTLLLRFSDYRFWETSLWWIPVTLLRSHWSKTREAATPPENNSLNVIIFTYSYFPCCLCQNKMMYIYLINILKLLLPCHFLPLLSKNLGIVSLYFVIIIIGILG